MSLENNTLQPGIHKQIDWDKVLVTDENGKKWLLANPITGRPYKRKITREHYEREASYWARQMAAMRGGAARRKWVEQLRTLKAAGIKLKVRNRQTVDAALAMLREREEAAREAERRAVLGQVLPPGEVE